MLLHLLLSSLSAIQSSDAVDPCEVRAVRAPVGREDERFGESLAWNGEVLAVSSTGFPRQSFIGTVYLYERSGDNWFFLARLDPDQPSHPDEIPLFGSALEWDGDVLHVGARGLNSFTEGRVYRFEDDGSGNWVQRPQMVAPDATGDSGFGSSIHVHEDQLFVADNTNDLIDSAVGTVYVYDRSGEDWVFRQRLDPSDGGGFDLFGSSIATEGERMVIGATVAEKAYAFERQSDETWLEVQILTSPTSATQSFFGASAAMGDGLLFVGAYRTSIAETWDGVVEVFEHDGSSWVETQTLVDSVPAQFGNLGFHVSYSEGALYAGALAGPVDNFGPGRLIVFEEDGGVWSESARLSKTFLNALDRFGYDTVVDGDLLLVGAPGYAPFTESPGFVMSYSLSGLTCADFTTDVDILPASTGGMQTLNLDAGPENGGDLFVIAGSVTGVYRGVAVGSVRVPIDLDGYTSALLDGQSNIPLSAATGVLDGSGQATVTLDIGPEDAFLPPLKLHHAYVLIDATSGALDTASIPVELSFDNSL